MNPARPLRVALLVDSFFQRRWISSIIQDIQSSNIAEIVLIVKNATTVGSESRLKRYWHNRKYLLYALYNRLDKYKVNISNDAFEIVDIQPLISACPVIEVQPQMTKYSDTFATSDLERIRSYQLDVALAFGFRILKGDILGVARYGVWSYHHGDNLVNRGGPAGFWEVMEGQPVTGSTLQVLTEDLDNGTIIYRSWSPTADRFSVKINRNNLYWKSSAFVIRKLRDLADGLPLVNPSEQIYQPYSERLYKTPTNRELSSSLSRLIGKYLASKIDSAIHFDQWSLAYRFRTSGTDANNTMYRFKELQPPKDRFWADPFPVKVDDRYYIFFEEYEYNAARGHISVIELDRTGILEGPRKVLSTDYHLSYPFVFHWNGSYYMVPESAANKTIELYKCAEFPDRWQLAAVLMKDIRAQDTTLFEQNGQWWMFFAAAEQAIADELYLYYAENPFGPWKPHRRNPVKSDIRSARPAGRLFYWNGELYRPGQDGSTRYGSAISINRVLRMDIEEFAELEVSRIQPRWRRRLRGTHTLNAVDDLTIVDCLVKRFR
jgi:hypothetical protein